MGKRRTSKKYPLKTMTSEKKLAAIVLEEENQQEKKETESSSDESEVEAPKETKREKKRTPAEKSEIVKMFLEMLNMVKLYHWNTHSYAQHKATDDLYDKLGELVDQFVEVMQGKMFSPNRIRIINEEIRAITPHSKTKMTDRILLYIEQLQNFNHLFSAKRDSDLLNIRDEMLAVLNQFLYLFSFDQI